MSAASKKVLVVMEDVPGTPHPVSGYFKEALERDGHAVTTCPTIVEGFSHLGDDRNKYDLVILDPLNQQIMLNGPMSEPSKIAALGVLARAKKGSAQTIVSNDETIVAGSYDKAALGAHADQFVAHGQFRAMMDAAKTALAGKQLS